MPTPRIKAESSRILLSDKIQTLAAPAVLKGEGMHSALRKASQLCNLWVDYKKPLLPLRPASQRLQNPSIKEYHRPSCGS